MKNGIEYHISTIFSNSPIPALVIDNNLKIIYYNKALSLFAFVSEKKEQLNDIFPENSPTVKFIQKSIHDGLPSIEHDLFHSASSDLYFSISHNVIFFDDTPKAEYHLYKFFDVSKFTRLKKSIQKYTDKILYENLSDHIEKSRLGGKYQNCSIMFLDVRGYTSFSENEKAEEVLETLNHYFNSIVGIIEKRKGIINKFIGDAILAYFISSQTDSAMNAALDILKRVAEINIIKDELNQRILNLGIGIHHGKVIIGNVGSFHRMDYTVLGDTVNIASRLCGVAKENEIVITPEFFNQIQNRKLAINKTDEQIELKGKSRSLLIHRIKTAT